MYNKETQHSQRVALVHDWLTGMRGGEKVLQEIALMYPQADIFTLLHIPGSVSPELEERKIYESFISRLPFAKTRYRNYLPLFPMAIESFDLRGYDLVISSSHCVAKGALAPAYVKHLCYILTPMRYAYDMFHEYFSAETTGRLKRFFISRTMTRLRVWDQSTHTRVDDFAADSEFVAARVKRYYGREASIVYPPVDTEFFAPGDNVRDDYYLIISALEPYKRLDIAINAFNKSGRRLKIIGDGSQFKRLKKSASKNIEFFGRMTDEEIRGFYRSARAFIFPGVEDFGIAPVEAQACGLPVIAFGFGGVTETIKNGETGVFFHEQTPEALNSSIDKAEKMNFNKNDMRRNSLKFSREAFRSKFTSFVEKNTGSI